MISPLSQDESFIHSFIHSSIHSFMMRFPTVLVLPLLLFSTSTDADVIDLSKDFETATMESPGAASITATASVFPGIRASLVLEHGKIVAEYVRDDIDPTDPFQVWSITKSWTSMLIGILIDEGLLGLEETLGEIFTDSAAWTEVNDTEVDFRQNVTIYEILTMTSGLVDPPPSDVSSPLAWMDSTQPYDGGEGGGGKLAGLFSWPSLGEKGEFSYLSESNILSYVIQDKTGMTPREYAAEKVFPAFGMQDSDINWWQNSDGIEYASHGLELTIRQMAKFGQLYLQSGLAAPDTQLITGEWASDSTSVQVENATFIAPFDPELVFVGKYGYLFWLFNMTDAGLPNVGEIYCMIGFGGQDICVSTELERVSVQQRDYEDGMGNTIVATVALDKTVSFAQVENENTATLGVMSLRSCLECLLSSCCCGLEVTTTNS